MSKTECKFEPLELCAWPRYDLRNSSEDIKKVLTIESNDGRVLFTIEVIKEDREERLQSAC